MVEYGTAEQIFASPKMPYTQGCSHRCRGSTTASTAARTDQGPAAEPLALAARLRVRAALRLPHADLRRTGAALRFRRRPRRAVLSLRRTRQGSASRSSRDALPSCRAPVNASRSSRSSDLVQILSDPRRASCRATSATSTPSTASSFTIAPGETLGLVGESGSGKTTIGRLLLAPAAGNQGRDHLRRPDVFALEPRRRPPAAPRRCRSSSRTRSRRSTRA